MRLAPALLASLLLASGTSLVVAQTKSLNPRPAKVLRNGDVLLMVESKMDPALIVSKIVRSSCAFDTFPPVLKGLKLRGVPDSVLEAMVNAPSGPPTNERRRRLPGPPRIVEVTIPAGSVVEVGVPLAVGSAKVEKGSQITFHAARPVKVDGVTVIPSGAPATARVVSVRRGGSWGRPGELRWSMLEVTAADGTRVPLLLDGKVRGGNKGETVASGAAATVALAGVALPPLAPLAVLWGLLRGDDALIAPGENFRAVVSGESKVRAAAPQEKPVTFRDVKTLAEISAQKPAELQRLNRESILRRW